MGIEKGRTAIVLRAGKQGKSNKIKVKNMNESDQEDERRLKKQ